MKLPGFFCNDLYMKNTFIEKYVYDEKGPPDFLLPLLKGLSYFQKLGMWARSKRKVYFPNVYTVSFGGITVGGVGKTPAVIERAEKEIELNKRKICVMSRGYGSERDRGIVEGTYHEGKVCVRRYKSERERLPNREEILPWNKVYKILGDELTLMLYRLHSITVIKDPNRVRAMKWAEQRGFDIVILDDAYQYLMLGRNENILLLSALNPWGNGLIFPAGILREPLTAMQRATEIWITHCDQTPEEKLMKIKKYLTDMCPEKNIRWTYHKPLYWSKFNAIDKFPVDYFKDKEVDVFCAIGNPKSFLNILQKHQIPIKNTYICRDHTPIPHKILKTNRPILTTEKNLSTLEVAHAEVYALCIGLSDYLWD